MLITLGIQYVNEVGKLLKNKKKQTLLNLLGILVGHHKVNQSAKNFIPKQ